MRGARRPWNWAGSKPIFTVANALLFAAPAVVVDPQSVVDILGTQNGRGGSVGQKHPRYRSMCWSS